MVQTALNGLKPKLTRTAHGRFLKAYVPAVIAIIVVFVLGFETVALRSARSDLEDRMNRLGANLSIILAEPVAVGQIDLIRSVLANAINDQDIALIRVRGAADQTLSELSRAEATPDPELVFEKTLKLGQGDQTLPVGHITLMMTSERLQDAMVQRLYLAGLLSFLLLAAIVVVGSFVYRRVIGEPLERLTDVINQTDQGRGVARVDPLQDDEVGDVIRAFNSMRDRQHRNELDLEMAREGLEKRVRERTSDLKRAHDKALAANRAKSQFLANMSHEFRTPLNAIIGFAEILESNAIKNPELQQEYAGDIRESGVHLLNLINDLLDLSKAEAGKLELQESVLDVTSTVEACIGMVRQSAADKGIDIGVSIPTSSPAITGDERKIRQMVLNLLSNAVKFTPKAGHIQITSRPTFDGGLELAVSDTGIGIPEKDQERVLQPFIQVDSTYARSYTGTGLGLPLVRVLAELHQGSLSLSSKPGQGTTVSIYFPADRLLYDARIAKGAD